MQRPIVSLLSLLLTLAALALVFLYQRVDALEASLTSIEQELTPLPSRVASTPPKPLTPRGDLSEAERSAVELFSQRSASVAHITTAQVRTDLFRLRALEVPSGSGSGFVWDEAGHIITNYHVIQGADRARVTLPDHSSWEARLVGASERNDLAVLRIAARAPLSPIPLGTSHDLSVGQSVFAIGSPFGLDYTMSTGIISGLGREIQGISGLPIVGAIQTDAAINPGNSGGPLLDSQGRLIGINTSILSPSGASAGVGFAIPADTVARVVPQLIQYGREVRPTIGVDLAEDILVRRLGLEGVLVLSVLDGSPAQAAGLIGTRRDVRTGQILLGDLITALAGRPIKSSADLYLALEKHQAGERVALTVVREGQTRTVEVVLTSNVANAASGRQRAGAPAASRAPRGASEGAP